MTTVTVLFDTDVFWKLGAASLLDEAALLLGYNLHDCRVLPALVHMLRGGHLRKSLGEEACDLLLPLAETIPILAPAPTEWLEKLVSVDSVDVGEAQLFAAGAASTHLVLSGDKRAVRSMSQVEDFAIALTGRVIVPEALLLALCDRLGTEYVRARMRPLLERDGMIRQCFGDITSDPRVGLESYFGSIQREVNPLILWSSIGLR